MDILLYNERKKLALNEINLKPVKLLGEWKIPIGWGLKLLKINILLNLMLLMTDPQYALVSNTPYVRPAHPGIFTLPNGATPMYNLIHYSAHMTKIYVSSTKSAKSSKLSFNKSLPLLKNNTLLPC